MQRLPQKLILALVLLPAGAPVVGYAQSVPASPPPILNPAPLNPDEAAAIARTKTGGRVLDVRPLANGDPAGFEVRVLLDEGKVRTLLIDGASGQPR